MSIHLNCQCGKVLKTSENAAGKRVRCPACGAVHRVPSPDTGSAPAVQAGEAPCYVVGENEGREAATAAKCPWCGRPLRPRAVICVECGFDLRTGQKLRPECHFASRSWARPLAQRTSTWESIASGWYQPSPKTSSCLS